MELFLYDLYIFLIGSFLLIVISSLNSFNFCNKILIARNVSFIANCYIESNLYCLKFDRRFFCDCYILVSKIKSYLTSLYLPNCKQEPIK